MNAPAFAALLLLLAAPAVAQTPSVPPAAQPPAPGQTPAVIATDAREVREQLREVLAKYPPEVGRILKMDPTMLSNDGYLEQYPVLQQFMSVHPEIVRNPSFYLEFVPNSFDYMAPRDPRSRAIDMWGRALEGFSVFAVVAFISATIAWLVKTMLNHRRWLRASRVQTEVHNKLLDRFAGTNELLAYIQTPAGRRFLEAAPIPLDAPPERVLAAPINRVQWSIQAGIVLIAGGFGFQYVSGRVFQEVGEGLWIIGVLSMAFGLGFVFAGVFSYVMSRRLGLFEPAAPIRDAEHGDSPAV